MSDVAKPRVWPVFVAFVAVLAFQVAASIPVAIAAFGAGGASFDIKAVLATAPALAAFTFASMTSLVLALSALASRPWRARFSLPSFRASPINVAIAVVGTVGVGAFTSTSAQLLGLYDDSMLAHFAKAFASASLPAFLFISTCVVVTGALEEVFFRGYAQTRLSRRFGPLVGVLIASALFGTAHMDLVQGFFAFAFGVFLGFVALRTRSIATGLYAHAINNALASILPYAFADDAKEEPQILMAVLGAAALVFAVVALWWRTRNAPPAEIIDEGVAGSRAKRFGLVAFAAMVLLGCATVGAIVVVAAKSMAGFTVTPDAAHLISERARAFGLDHEDRQCVDEALRQPSTERLVFVQWCLARARPTGLCEGAPAPTEVMAVSTWAQDECKAMQQTDLLGCTAVMAAASRHCATR